jgi:uncharacterized protein
MVDNYFIHLFETPLNKYFYDVNTNKIIDIPENVYMYLKNKESKKEAIEVIEKYIKDLKDQGYLKDKKVQQVKHPRTKYIEYFVNNKMNDLVLQVTQDCNLRCEYCPYSIGNKHRIHNKSTMDVEIAKKGIDFLVKHSRESEELNIGFYGGEPLIEFELIKECVKYADLATEGKKLSYSMTTNGTIMNDEIIDFFYKNKFLITVSLDGPAHVHNRSRHFAYSDKGSFDTIIENLQKIEKKYPSYYREKVIFNAVVTAEYGFLEIDNFFKEEYLTKDNAVTLSMDNNLENNMNPKIERTYKEDYIIERQYLEFLMLLSKIGWLEDYKVSAGSEDNFRSLATFERKMRMDKRSELPDEWHHGGPCMPGEKRLFMTVDGNFYPCEKVSEINIENNIGNIFEGVDVDKVNSILNIGCRNQKKCTNCWAYSLCSVCILYYENRENLDNVCSSIRKDIEDKMKTLCLLNEFNYKLDHEMIQI